MVKAVTWFRKAADQGNVEAQVNLALCYEEGRGVEADMVQAVAWFRKAAEQGGAFAQVNLARCYEEGWGVEADMVQAVTWFRKAAEQGDKFAQVNLARYPLTMLLPCWTNTKAPFQLPRAVPSFLQPKAIVAAIVDECDVKNNKWNLPHTVSCCSEPSFACVEAHKVCRER